MSLKIICVFVVCVVQKIVCFNLDVNFPIIYNDPTIAGRDYYRGSYFGFSVVLYDGGNNSQPWIRIGAPRGNSLRKMNVHEFGAVYKCPIFGPCRIENWKVSIRSPGPRFKSKFDGNWLGASMDISKSRIVTCSPRWINQIYKEKYYMEGGCYWSKLNNTNYTEMLIPLAAGSTIISNGDIKAFFYAMGQAGMSVHLPEHTPVPELLMGAPGFYNWKGTVILYRDGVKETSINNRAFNPEDFKNVIIPHNHAENTIFSFNLFGYAVSSGYFFSRQKLFYVVGAPTSSIKSGRVLLFDSEDKNFGVNQTKTGNTLGEYFGATLCVADVNGDMLDDLLVGAPHYSSKRDEGRVYVFLGNSQGNLITPDQGALLEGTAQGGQFGLAIQKLGDLDGDGFQDVVIGAPYEDDNHGVIYIYNGGQKGLRPKESQKIYGKQFQPYVEGFGISFSKGVDIDGNHVNDLAIGAYLTGMVILLRGRPVVKIHQKVIPDISRLNHSATEFKVNICLWYTGKHLPPSLSVQCNVQVEMDLNRAYMNLLTNKKHDHTLQDIILVSEKETCITLEINVKQNIKNYADPLVVAVTPILDEGTNSVNITWASYMAEENDNFCKTCPVVHQQVKRKTTKIEIPFALDCGNDNICNSDLKIFAQFLGLSSPNTFIFGSKTELELEIIVENTKEPAYKTMIELKLPEDIHLSYTPAICESTYYSMKESESNSFLSVSCSVDNPLHAGQKKKIILNLDMEQATKPELNFELSAKSVSDDTDYSDNSQNITLKLITEASIKIKGNSGKDSYFYGDDAADVLQQIYEVQKTGASPLGQIMLQIIIPTTIQTSDNEISFLQMYEPIGYHAGQSFTCKADDSYEFISEDKMNIETLSDEMGNEGDGMNEEENVTLSESMTAENNENKKVLRNKRTADTTLDIKNEFESDLPQSNRTLFLNCSMSEITCLKINCFVGPFKKTSNVILPLKMIINNKVLEPIMGAKDIIFLSTYGYIKEIDGTRLDRTRVSSLLIGKPKVIEIDIWIIIAASIVGLLILFLVIVGLIKLGFFHRKNKKKLEDLKKYQVFADVLAEQPFNT